MIRITIIYIVIMAAGVAVAGMNHAKYKKRNKELYNCNTDLNMERIRLENALKKLSKEKQEVSDGRMWEVLTARYFSAICLPDCTVMHVTA